MTTPAQSELNVEVSTEEPEGGQVVLAVRVPPEPVQSAREHVVQTLSRRVNIPGFRKGKAPRALLERFLDQDYLKQQLIEHLLPEAYKAALGQVDAHPLTDPDVEGAALADDGALTFTVTFVRRPEVTLGEYKGLAATKHVTPVTEEAVQAELDRVRQRQSRYADLPEGEALEKGDLAVVDYDMFLNGEKRDQGSATGYPLEVGADELFPQLSEALPGVKAGETREFEVMYPENHADPDLAGQTATFKATVRQARRRMLPELDDEFAKQVSDLSTMEELRTRIRENLEAIGESVAQQDLRNQLVRQVMESSSLDVPEAVVRREVEQRIAEVTAELDRRGDELSVYLRRHGRTLEDWRADLETEARQDVREMLVLDEVGEREKIEVTEEEMHAEIHRLAEHENVSAQEMRERLERSESQMTRVVNRLHRRKTLQFLVDTARITEEIVEAKTEETSERAAETE